MGAVRARMAACAGSGPARLEYAYAYEYEYAYDYNSPSPKPQASSLKPQAPMSQRPATLFDPHPHAVPPGTGVFGMWLFLAALSMLFIASLIGFIWMRVGFDHAPPMGSIDLPLALWASTVLIIVSSFTIHRALQNVRHERQTRFRSAMLVTFLLAIGFLIVQAPSLAGILREHWPKVATYAQALEDARNEATHAGGPVPQDHPTLVGKLPVEGFIFGLIAIHALHVLGGIIPMAIITWRAHQGRYDHEHHAPVQYLTMYWHFLDGVWIVMFATLLLAA